MAKETNFDKWYSKQPEEVDKDSAFLGWNASKIRLIKHIQQRNFQIAGKWDDLEMLKLIAVIKDL